MPVRRSLCHTFHWSWPSSPPSATSRRYAPCCARSAWLSSAVNAFRFDIQPRVQAAVPDIAPGAEIHLSRCTTPVLTAMQQGRARFSRTSFHSGKSSVSHCLAGVLVAGSVLPQAVRAAAAAAAVAGGGLLPHHSGGDCTLGPGPGVVADGSLPEAGAPISLSGQPLKQPLAPAATARLKTAPLTPGRCSRRRRR